MIDEAAAVLDFWFGELTPKQHFAHDPVVDRTIMARFGDLHGQLSRTVPDRWQGDPESLLAAVIVLDQFSRNLYRDDPRAFAQDAAALALTRQAVDRGDDHRLAGDRRQFLYLPLMHSEDAADQTRSVELMAAIGNAQATAFARQHQAIIARFGRFPHRNAVVGRASTPAEVEFLKQPGSAF